MKYFMSGEISKEVYEDYSVISNIIEKKIIEFLKEKSYGTGVEKLSVIPTIFSPKIFESLPYKERMRYSPKTKEAEFRLRIDYQDFKDSNEEGKRKLIIENIIKSIRLLQEKTNKYKVDFDGKRLEKDILSLFF